MSSVYESQDARRLCESHSAKRANQQPELRSGRFPARNSRIEIAELLRLGHSNMPRRRSMLVRAIEESRLARVRRGLMLIIQKGEGGDKGGDRRQQHVLWRGIECS